MFHFVIPARLNRPKCRRRQLVLAAVVHVAHAAVGVLADEGVTVLAVFNAMRAMMSSRR